MRPMTRMLLIGAVACLMAAPVSAQRSRRESQNNALSWSVPNMMDRHVRLMTRHYNLSEMQQEFTSDFLKLRVKRFLTDYENDVRWMFYEYNDYSLKGEVPPIEIIQEWGRRGQPLLSAIRKEIIEGNMEWRQILGQDQLKKHDRDMQIMTEQFDEWDEKLQRWSKGNVRDGDFPGMVSHGAGRARVRDSEDAWDFFVRKFIQDYKLDDEQRKTAYTLLNNLKREARAYRRNKEHEFEQIKQKEEALSKAKPSSDPKELKEKREKFKEIRKERLRLEEPISKGMFTKLKEGLMTIPRSDQKRAFDERMNKLNALAKKGRTITTQPATAPAGETPSKASASDEGTASAPAKASDTVTASVGDPK